MVGQEENVFQSPNVMPASQSSLARTPSPCPVALPGQLGSSSPPVKARVIFLDWPGPIFSQVGGAPRSGVYISSEARNKDERGPGRKVPTSLLFITPLLLPAKAPPFLTEAPLCDLGLSVSPVPLIEFVLGEREEFRE